MNMDFVFAGIYHGLLLLVSIFFVIKVIKGTDEKTE